MAISLFVPRSPQGTAMTSWDGWWSRLGRTLEQTRFRFLATKKRRMYQLMRIFFMAWAALVKDI